VNLEGGTGVPYVNIPKDLSGVEGHLAFGLTKRQLIAAILIFFVFLPGYFFLRRYIGQLAMFLLLAFSAPPFIWATWKVHDGRRIEHVLMNYIRVRFIRPKIRPYKTENIYSAMEMAGKIQEVIEDASAGEAEDQGHKKSRSLRKAAKGRTEKDCPAD